jgi:hypothetical protein
VNAKLRDVDDAKVHAGTPPNAWARQKIALVITSLVKAWIRKH